jgi:hypothetical protein
VSAGAAATLADLRRAITLLAEIGDAAATRTADALTRWLAGEDFDQAAGLPSDWRWRVRIAARDQALGALCDLRADLTARALARLILGDPVNRGARRDGWRGYLDDLRRADPDLSDRQLRRLIGELRGPT